MFSDANKHRQARSLAHKYLCWCLFMSVSCCKHIQTNARSFSFLFLFFFFSFSFIFLFFFSFSLFAISLAADFRADRSNTQSKPLNGIAMHNREVWSRYLLLPAYNTLLLCSQVTKRDHVTLLMRSYNNCYAHSCVSEKNVFFLHFSLAHDNIVWPLYVLSIFK